MRETFSHDIPLEGEFSLLVPEGAQVAAVVCLPARGPVMYFDAPHHVSDHELWHFVLCGPRGVIPCDGVLERVGFFQTDPTRQPWFVYRRRGKGPE